jgi:hypothetical protein
VARAAAPPAPAQAATDGAGRSEPRAVYNVVAARSLFSPSRTETSAAATAASAAPKPFLHGVVVDEARSRAFLEDPTSKKVYGYAIGDTVSGGKLEAIRADRVVIARPDGKVEVLLRDPSKPQPAPVAATAGAPTVPGRAPVAGQSQNPFLGIIQGQQGQQGQQPPPGGALTPGIVAPAPTPAPTPAPAPGAQAGPQAPQRLFQQLSPDFFRRQPTNPYHPEVNQPRTQ